MLASHGAKLWVSGETTDKPMNFLPLHPQKYFLEQRRSSAVVHSLDFFCLLVLFVVVALARNATGVSGASSCARLVTFDWRRHAAADAGLLGISTEREGCRIEIFFFFFRVL